MGRGEIDLRRLRGAVSPNHDDDLRGLDGRTADRLRLRSGCRITSSARTGSCRRLALFAVDYALYHARDLHRSGRSAAKAGPPDPLAGCKPNGATAALEIGSARIRHRLKMDYRTDSVSGSGCYGYAV